MELLAPWSLAGLVLVPAIFLWGLLAPRGRPVVVGSLMLWRRALGTGPVGRPSARVRLRDPLLWLDAALVLLVVLACARPAFKTAAPTEPVATLVIDRTASMAAEGGGRLKYVWDNLRDRAEPLLGQLGDAPVRIVYVPDAAGSVSAETLRGAEFLARGPAPWEPVRAARDLWPVVVTESAADRDRPVVAMTDVAPAGDVPRNVYVLATGRDSRNAGLLRVAARIEGNRWWLLVSAKSSLGAPGPAPLAVMSGDQVLTAVPGFLAPGSAADRVLAFDGPPPRELDVSLAGLEDEFPDDNAAYLVLEPAGGIRVLLVGNADPALRRALTSRQDVVVVEGQPGAGVTAGEADVVVAYGAPLPADWTGPAAIVAPAGAVGPVQPADTQAAPAWQVAGAHPLAGGLYLEPPRLGSVRAWALGPGAQLLVGTRDGPLIVTWESGGVRRLAVLFGFDEPTTDWPRRAGFPVFWSHALEWLCPTESRPSTLRTYLPLEALPGGGGVAPARPGFYRDGVRGVAVGVSFIGTDEGFQAGPGRDDSKAATEAIRKSIEAGRRATLAEAWPYLAAAALVLIILRSVAAR